MIDIPHETPHHLGAMGTQYTTHSEIQPELFPREAVPSPSVLDHPVLKSGLITYIGNKRALIPFINEGFQRLEEKIGRVQTMADPFAGSGVVSRLGRLRGATVVTGDAEDYTRPFGRTYIETVPSAVEALFEPRGGYQAVLDDLNALDPLRTDGRAFFSAHYAPRSTDDADPDRERMFFTRENALKLDAMLSEIHDRLPLAPLAKDILLASVLVEMSIHNNTSGVMKGFHHGWGGRGGDALSRILAPIGLEPVNFIDGPPGLALVGLATETLNAGAEWIRRNNPARSHAFDIVYADPPYNIHQYGANYHLLTSAVRWDNYDPGPVTQGSRAGIRRDHFRSDFCSRRGARAAQAFQEFLDAADTRALLISYNDEGILSAEEIFQMLSEDRLNTVEILTRGHTKFRGGKATQSGLRTEEYLFVVERGQRQSRHDRDRIRSVVEGIELNRTGRSRFIIPSRWRDLGGTVVEERSTSGWRCTTLAGDTVEIDRELRVHQISPGEGSPKHENDEELDLREYLEKAGGTIVEAVEELVGAGRYEDAIFLLKRLKIRKYRREFVRIAHTLAVGDLPDPTRRRLSELYLRVTGDRLPEDRPR